MKFACSGGFLVLPFLVLPYFVAGWLASIFNAIEMDASGLNTGEEKIRISSEGYLEMYVQEKSSDWHVVAYEGGSSPRAQLACFQLGTFSRNATVWPGPRLESSTRYYEVENLECRDTLTSCKYYFGGPSHIRPAHVKCSKELVATAEVWSKMESLAKPFWYSIAVLCVLMMPWFMCKEDHVIPRAAPFVYAILVSSVFWTTFGAIIGSYKTIELGPRHELFVGHAMIVCGVVAGSTVMVSLCGICAFQTKPSHVSLCERKATFCPTDNIGVDLSKDHELAFPSAALPNDFSPKAVPFRRTPPKSQSLLDFNRELENAGTDMKKKLEISFRELDNYAASDQTAIEIRTEAASTLVELTENDDSEVRVIACQCLAAKSDTDVVNPMIVDHMSIRAEDIDGRVRMCALEIFFDLLGAPDKAEIRSSALAVVDNLIRSDIEPLVRIKALDVAEKYCLDTEVTPSIRKLLAASIHAACHDRVSEVERRAKDAVSKVTITPVSCFWRSLNRILYILSVLLAYGTVVTTGFFINTLVEPASDVPEGVAVALASIVSAAFLFSIIYNVFIALRVSHAINSKRTSDNRARTDGVVYRGKHRTTDTCDAQSRILDLLYLPTLISPELMLNEMLLGKHPPPDTPIFIRRSLWVGDLVFNLTSVLAPIAVQIITGKTTEISILTQVFSIVNIGVRLCRSAVFSVILKRFTLHSAFPHLNLDDGVALVIPRRMTKSGLGGRAYIKQDSGCAVSWPTGIMLLRLVYFVVACSTRLTLLYTGVALIAADSSFVARPVRAIQQISLASGAIFGLFIFIAVLYSIIARIFVIRKIFSLVYISASSVSELLSMGLTIGLIYFATLLSTSHPLFAFLPTSPDSESAAHITEAFFDIVYLVISLTSASLALASYKDADIAIHPLSSLLVAAIALTSLTIALSGLYLLRHIRNLDIRSCSTTDGAFASLCDPCYFRNIENDPLDNEQELQKIPVDLARRASVTRNSSHSQVNPLNGVALSPAHPPVSSTSASTASKAKDDGNKDDENPFT